MSEAEILKELFDDKIVSVIQLFIREPEKQFYLTEVANLSKVNVTTTFRILNKLVNQGFIKSKVIGKVRLYQLEMNDKTNALTRVLKKESSPLQFFLEKVKAHPRIKKVVLESSDKSGAKILIVGDFIPRERLSRLCEDIKNKHSFKINFVELNENQFKDLEGFKSYDFDKKTIFDRKKLNPEK